MQLVEALAKISDTINILQNEIKTVLRDSPDQKERDSKINQVKQGRSKSYTVFMKELGSMSLEERKIIRFGALPWLWKEFPKQLELDDKVGNPDDPGDGLIYNESDVNKATTVLKDFYGAWSETTIQTDPRQANSLPKVGQITSMAKICLILCGMKQQRLVDYFCASQKMDVDLPLSLETAKRIMYQDRGHAAIFVTEQYRAVRRDWNDGDHIEIPEEEPLPLCWEHKYGQGSFGSVQRYRDAFGPVRVLYAVKEQNAADARKHLQTEIAHLNKVDHRHIVQFVKSYQRGSLYGLLLRPAATTDLEKLLGRYRRNQNDYQKSTEEQRKARVLLKPVLLTAFGCLSHGLSHIHGRTIRHKDIKPANILYEKGMGNDRPARLLWADFGLAYHFGTIGSSKTRSWSRYSRRYAAPECMEESQATVNAKAAGLAGVHTNQDTDEESEESEVEEEQEEQKNSSEWRPEVGRSSDIFSFGCVFLEILSTITDAKIPNADSESYEFWRNITKLQAWAKTQKNQLEQGNPLRVPFALATKMIRYKAMKRPKIDKIVEVLADTDTAAAKMYFCPQCLREVEKSRLEREKAANLLGLDRYKFNTKSSEITESGGSELDAYERHVNKAEISSAVNQLEHSPARMPVGLSHIVISESEVAKPALRSSISEASKRLIRFSD